MLPLLPDDDPARHAHPPPGPCLTPPLQDILTGDEILSDSYDLKEVDGVVYEADCAMITEGAVSVGRYFPSCRKVSAIETVGMRG